MKYDSLIFTSVSRKLDWFKKRKKKKEDRMKSGESIRKENCSLERDVRSGL